ncbi:F-box protein At-B-like [Salvia divinorum]|uniref:F-box protein At-B-like n=1 Tax=Salvia divinorum TaxID=28513 RepID=A0ABD1I2T0_SALDI
MNNNNSKRFREKKTAAEDTGGAPSLKDGFPLPDTIVLSEIFARLELDTLCTVACVSPTLRSLVSQSLITLPSLDLSAFSPNGELVRCIAPRLTAVKSVTIDCLKVDECSIDSILGPHLQELNLLKCPSLSYHVLLSIGEKCPNLRNLVLELAGKNAPENFRKSFVKMLQNLLYLEHLSIKVRGTEIDAYSLTSFDLFLPRTLKSLKMQLVNEQDAGLFIEKLGDDGESLRKIANSSMSIASYQGFCGFTLTCLSLVLDIISDRLMASITSSLRLLVELDLEDRQCSEAKVHHDLTNSGLLLLGSCQYLTHLSIVRSRANYPASFKRVNDVGVLVLAESCRGLESVRLGGFSKVTDAGFSSLVHSCHNLKKLEIRNAPLLSDLAFHDMIGAASPLVELKMVSCNLITSEALAELASSSTLELLDTYNCRSIANACLDYISRLSKLTSINLGGSDITDSGLGALSKGDLPITSLCLRGCTRVTDKGIIRLLSDGIRIKEKLSSLDISNMPGVSDRAIRAVISCTDALSELRMRSCFHVTNESFHILASGKCDGRNLLRKLDISHCIGFSGGLVELLEEGHSFRGLRWLGVAGTYLVKSVAAICRMQPCLTVCFEGCEVGCHDGWQYHT